MIQWDPERLKQDRHMKNDFLKLTIVNCREGVKGGLKKLDDLLTFKKYI